MPKFVDLTGKTFARLTVLSLVGKRNGRFYWTCRCECGTSVEVPTLSLRTGNTKSCGCLHHDSTTTHGKSKTPEYTIWKAILQRCTNPRAAGFHRYGGRGIKVCDAWLHSFEAFLSDMGPRPSTGHSIDRIDNDGPYSPENCHWATTNEQNRNKSSNRRFNVGSEALTIADLAKNAGLSPRLVGYRLNHGWSVDRAISTPPQKQERLGGR